MNKENLIFNEEGFDKPSFMQYMEDTFRMGHFGRDTVENIVDYALKHHNHSLDSAAYFISDLVSEVEFYEVCGFFADNMLTRNGNFEKARFWTEKSEDAKRIAESAA
jgi:hypothetical protein